MDVPRSDSSGLRDYLRLALRRKWVILLAIVLVPFAAVVFSLRQEDRFKASAEVLLVRQNLPSSLGGGGELGLSGQADRVAQTQADLARIPLVARRTLDAAGLKNRSSGSFLNNSSVKPSNNSDVLTFSVEDGLRKLAATLATGYAHQFTILRRELDTGAFRRALQQIRTRINELEAQGDRTSPAYLGLVDKEQQLETAALLLEDNAKLIRAATTGKQVQPKPIQAGLIGLGLGIFLGLGLALLWDTLDTRVRSTEGVGERLGLPLLGRIPEPPRKLRGENHLVMLEEPGGGHAEAFRVLRTNLEFANLERGARTILVTSAVQGEGKSTTAANLGVALAYAGRHVVLVNLDLRRPHRNVIFRGEEGLTDVALGRLTLEQALHRVPLLEVGGGNGSSAEVASLELGVLEALDSGPLPPSPGDFLLTSALTEILHDLSERADMVLVDAPPLLTVGDALIISAKVDALLLVARMNIVRRPMLNELRRILHGVPAAKLGFVVTGAQSEEGYYYDYARGYEYATTHARQREQA